VAGEWPSDGFLVFAGVADKYVVLHGALINGLTLKITCTQQAAG
jgi:hypothetical protein